MVKVRKVAVNITNVCDLDRVHANVVDFLYQKGRSEYQAFPEQFKIDYYICHPSIENPSAKKRFSNSIVYSSPSINEQVLLDTIKHEDNKLVIKATDKISRLFFRSYVNSQTMHKNLYSDAYDCVINYSDNITKFKMNKHFNVYDPENTHFIENNLFYCDIICPMTAELDYSFFVTTQPTFNRVVIFWQFIRLLDDRIWGYNWWTDWKNNPEFEVDKFILPSWLDMQAISPRSAYGL